MNKRYNSPLRYPGGKAGLTDFFCKVLELNGLRGCEFHEPFAGGAGAALGLLKRGVVDRIGLNDADYRIFAFWSLLLNNTDELIERTERAELSIAEWRKQVEIANNPDSYNIKDIGFSTFYLNRCNRSGVIIGSGPIGGLEQNGNWKIDARFCKENLVARIIGVSKYKKQIEISYGDAKDYVKKLNRRRRKDVFIYMDPPYVNNSKRLYMDCFGELEHRKLYSYISTYMTSNYWVVSYDNNSLIGELYNSYNTFLIPVRYSLKQKTMKQEILIFSDVVENPLSIACYGKEVLLDRRTQ